MRRARLAILLLLACFLAGLALAWFGGPRWCDDTAITGEPKACVVLPTSGDHDVQRHQDTENP